MKNKNNKETVVFSTDAEYLRRKQEEEAAENAVETPSADKQILRVSRDSKQRGGKEVTLVRGWVGTEDDLTDLGKRLKTSCGVGGSAKDAEILIQGNHVERVVALLLSWGYTKTKKSGG
jgi:translation initiation factor 1